MTDIAQLDRELNQGILEGKILETFDRFYADHCTMQEGAQDPTHGKAANRQREEDFVASVAEFHGVELLSSAVGDGVSFSEWKFDYTSKEAGRLTYNQVAVRRWQGGKVVNERFYSAAS